jgi:hypothetical protein
MKRPIKAYAKMNTAELAEATSEFDKEISSEPGRLPGRAMNSHERRLWARARAKMGRPRIGGGAKRVMISLEEELLRRADSFATQHHLSRSQMIAEGLRRVMSK